MTSFLASTGDLAEDNTGPGGGGAYIRTHLHLFDQEEKLYVCMHASLLFCCSFSILNFLLSALLSSHFSLLPLTNSLSTYTYIFFATNSLLAPSPFPHGACVAHGACACVSVCFHHVVPDLGWGRGRSGLRPELRH